MKFEWETLNSYNGNSEGESIRRVKVFGGWIVRNNTISYRLIGQQTTLSESMVFVPDPNHDWEVEE